jgi:hypothetical protein
MKKERKKKKINQEVLEWERDRGEKERNDVKKKEGWRERKEYVHREGRESTNWTRKRAPRVRTSFVWTDKRFVPVQVLKARMMGSTARLIYGSYLKLRRKWQLYRKWGQKESLCYLGLGLWTWWSQSWFRFADWREKNRWQSLIGCGFLGTRMFLLLQLSKPTKTNGTLQLLRLFLMHRVSCRLKKHFPTFLCI